MNPRQRSVLVSLILVLVLLLGACGGPGAAPDAPDGAPETPPARSAELKAPEPAGAPDLAAPASEKEHGQQTAAAPATGDPTAPGKAPAPQAPAKPAAKPATAGDNTAAVAAAQTCTLSVDCKTIRADISRLNPEKAELVPADGVIFAPRSVEFRAGENVFNVLRREMRRAGIHLESVHTPVYDSAYIKGIHNLYEGDCGPLSGWTYRVNGQLPNYGVSQYLLQPGDTVEILYSCDLGRDVGGSGP